MKQLLIVILFAGINMSLNAGGLEDHQKACDDGMVAGCKGLGDFYYTAKGVKQNYLEAAKYYGKACDGGYLSGCSALGLIYEKAQGVEEDFSKAANLYAKACAGYDFNGCHRSGIIYKKSLGGTEQNFLKAKEFFTKACKDGDPRAPEIYEELFDGKAPKSR